MLANKKIYKLRFSRFSIFFLCTLLLFISSNTGLPAKVKGKRLALILATNYTGNQADIPPLKLCERDAKLMRKKLKTEGRFDDVDVLLGKMVTAKNVGEAISKLIKRVRSKDTVLIYFSGHGTYQNDASASNGMRNFLLMYKRPHLPDNLLDKWVRKIKTKKLVWIFDACYSGGIAGKSKRTRGSGAIPIERGQQGKVIENGDASIYFGDKAMIGSSSANQTAIEVGFPVNHGIFTYLFTQSLSPKKGDLNQDGSVTLLEAFEWTKPRVTQMAKRYSHNQTPVLGGNASGIFMAGSLHSKPPPASEVSKLPPAPQSKPPSPASADPVPNPIQTADPVTPAEPPVKPHKKQGTVTIFATIFKSVVAGPTSNDPKLIIARNKKKDVARKLAVKLSGHNYPLEIAWLTSKQLRKESGEMLPLGVYSHRGKSYKNRVAKILIRKVPTGVHEVQIEADGYPIIKERLGVEKDANKNKLFIIASLAGYGTIRGKVFFKSFDRPLAKHRIYMPVINQTNQTHSMRSSSDGSFWFLNLLPAKNYFIRASFAENLPLNNKKLTVRANTTTYVDVVLSRKLGIK